MEEKISELNPNRIDPENIRHLLDVSYPSAVRICETAVRQGVFDRKIEVIGPDGTVTLVTDRAEHVPEMVSVWVNEDGHDEEVTIPRTKLRTKTFYRLHAQQEENTPHLTHR